MSDNLSVPAPPPPPPPPDPVKAETEQLKALAELDKARAERIKALGLPSFEGKTTLGAGAGAIEGLILATDALFDAATLIAEAAVSVRRPDGSAHCGPFIVLAGEEAIDFGLAGSIRVEIDAFQALFQMLAPANTQALGMALAGTSIAALSALAGLLRTDTEITGLDFAQLTHRPLATATAGRLGPRAILPGAAIGGLAGNRLAGDLMGLAAERDRVSAARPDDPKVAPTLLRFDTFLVRVLTPDAAGQVPIARAGRVEQLLDEDPLVLRVHVEKAGGSLIVRKNLWSFFARDPLRVSAGLVVSYTVTDPATGSALAAGVFNCRAGEAKLGEIQRGDLPFSSQISSCRRHDRHALRFEARPTIDGARGRMTMTRTPPDQFSEADAEQAVTKATKNLTNADVALSEKISDRFTNARQMRRLLGEIQDVILRDNGIYVDLATGSDEDNEKLRKKTYGDLARWVFEKVRSSGQPSQGGESDQ